MKYIITESQYSKTIDKFITYQFEPHEEKYLKEFPNSIYWVKDGKIIVEIENSEYFWVEYDIWVIISKMFSLDGEEITKVIKEWLEEHYELGSLTPLWLEDLQQTWLEEH